MTETEAEQQAEPAARHPKMLHSPQAERSMVGACLLDWNAREVLMRELTAGDFYVWKYARTAEAIAELHKVGHQVDPVTVGGWLADHLGAQVFENMGGMAELVACTADCPSTRSAPTYAVRIRDRAARRQLKADLMAGVERVDDLAVDVEQVVDDLEAQLKAVDLPAGADPPPLTIEQFLADPMPYRWLVPNLLERGDRVIVTADEGGGKSTLLRQLAVQLAAGIHPFARQLQEPVTSLAVDLENSPQQGQRGYRRLFELARTPNYQTTFGQGAPDPFDPARVNIEMRPQGIDLLTRRDRQWFTSRVAMCRPDIILVGPIYKMHRGEPNDEKPAKQVADYLDELRAAYDCALIMEAHSPHSQPGKERDLRPYGASLWKRWPEFGFGIRKLPDSEEFRLASWRGARDAERLWPSKLRRGTTWPWINAHLADYDEEPPF